MLAETCHCLRRADEAFMRSLSCDDSPRGSLRAARLARRRGWRWIPSLGLYAGSAWFVGLVVIDAIHGFRAATLGFACLGCLIAIAPAIGRPPLSLRRLAIATWLWWIPTIGFLPVFGVGLLFAPAALAATACYVTGRIGARPQAVAM